MLAICVCGRRRSHLSLVSTEEYLEPGANNLGKKPIFKEHGQSSCSLLMPLPSQYAQKVFPTQYLNTDSVKSDLDSCSKTRPFKEMSLADPELPVVSTSLLQPITWGWNNNSCPLSPRQFSDQKQSTEIMLKAAGLSWLQFPKTYSLFKTQSLAVAQNY